MTAGYHYTKHTCAVPDAVLLRVQTTDLEALKRVVDAANKESRKGYDEPTYH